jgi:proteasome alpha subunit
MGGLGQQSDIEAVRMAALDFSHQEGYTRSESDVTIKRVVNAISTPIKRAFADFSAAPVISRTLFAEVGPTPAQDLFVMLDFDGDYHVRHFFGYAAPTSEAAERLEERLSKSHLHSAGLDTAIDELDSIWRDGLEPDPSQTLEARLKGLKKEIAVLERSPQHDIRFRYLTEADD